GAWTCPNPGGIGPFYVQPLEIRLDPAVANLAPGQCQEFHLLGRLVQNGPFVDLTENTTESDWNPAASSSASCILNNQSTISTLLAKKNMFCVPQRACNPLGCPSRLAGIVVTYRGQQ